MSNTWWRTTMLLVSLIVLASTAHAQQINLTPYLQAELNEVAMLASQSNYLQQQGDPLGASVVASYIPDHQMQINRLAATMRQFGQNPDAVRAMMTPVTGTRAALIEHDLDAHRRVIEDYQTLANRTTDPTVRQLALLGMTGASRHHLSLRVARGATLATPEAMGDGLLAALTLERTAVLDLQIQAGMLRNLGDAAGSNLLMTMAQAHQNQAANLETMVRQWGGDASRAMPLQPVPLATRAEILATQRSFDTQMTNNYAILISVLPPSPLYRVAWDGQLVALTSLTQLGRFTTLA